eukprot:614534-Prymnesium_polylepis.1
MITPPRRNAAKRVRANAHLVEREVEHSHHRHPPAVTVECGDGPGERAGADAARDPRVTDRERADERGGDEEARDAEASHWVQEGEVTVPGWAVNQE